MRRPSAGAWARQSAAKPQGQMAMQSGSAPSGGPLAAVLQPLPSIKVPRFCCFAAPHGQTVACHGLQRHWPADMSLVCWTLRVLFRHGACLCVCSHMRHATIG